MNQDTHIIDWEKKKTVLHIVVFLSKPTSEHETGAESLKQYSLNIAAGVYPKQERICRNGNVLDSNGQGILRQNTCQK